MPDTIEQWLGGLGLGRYATLFAENDIDHSLLAALDDTDLEKLGIASLGHRKRLLAAIAELSCASADKAAEPIATATLRADAERRQLTVMFCDMVGSTALSARLDPEDYREVVRTYQDACAGEITRGGGYVAQFLGDGVLAYFGWPQAREDDARQAIAAGLGIVTAVAGITMPSDEAPLAVHIGIATGPVVVGDIIGEASAQEVAVTGETPNLAARLQEIAEPNTVVIAATTRTLAGGAFIYEALGARPLEGFDAATEIWRVTGARPVESRFAAAHGGELTPLIGREEELELLLRRWQRAKAGEGQVVLLAGEPGIGKSRLVRALRDTIGGEPHTRLVYQCSPHHTSSALYPITRQLEHAAGFETGDTADAKLDKLGTLLAQAGRPTEGVMPLIASLLSIPTSERYRLPELTPQQLKDRTLAALVDQLAGLAERQSVLFVLEDAHWIDPTSLELMELITERIKDLPVLAIVTYRPEFTAAWIGLSHVTLQALNRLDARECAAIASELAGGHALPAEFVEQLVAKTDGVPLFVEELTRSVLEAGAGTRPERGAAQTEQAKDIVIPATLQEALGARLDRSPAAREVAQVGAAIGREFSYDLVAPVVSIEATDLCAALDDLAGSGLIFARGVPPDATYMFKHALIQDTAYESMMRSKRREVHRRIAETLLALRPEIPSSQPAVLARHTTEAGLLEDAVGWWALAGKTAAARSANPEAIELLERGLALIAKLPESETRDRSELALQTALVGPLISVTGPTSTEIEAAFKRTLELCDRVDAPEEIFRALSAKALSHRTRGQLSQCYETASELVRRAERASNEGAILMGHRELASSLFLLGRLVEAQKHNDFVLSAFSRERHDHLMITYGQNPAANCEAYNAVIHWILGWPDKAKATAKRAIAGALALDHFSTIFPALWWIGFLAQGMARDVEALRQTREHIDALVSQGGKMHASWEINYRLGHIRPESLTNPSQRTATETLRLLSELASLRRNSQFFPLFWGQFLAENYLAIGDPDKALDANDRGFEFADESGEHWSDSELLRVRGEALAMRDGVHGNDEAETCLRRAIDDARSRSAKSFELRAAMALARFLRDQGRAAEARETLAPIYAWFTEGFGTPDLIDARALLDELG